MESQSSTLPHKGSLPIQRFVEEPDLIFEVLPRNSRIYYEAGNSLQEHSDRREIEKLYKKQSIEKESEVREEVSIKPFISPDPKVPPTLPAKDSDSRVPPPAPATEEAVVLKKRKTLF